MEYYNLSISVCWLIFAALDVGMTWVYFSCCQPAVWHGKMVTISYWLWMFYLLGLYLETEKTAISFNSVVLWCSCGLAACFIARAGRVGKARPPRGCFTDRRRLSWRHFLREPPSFFKPTFTHENLHPNGVPLTHLFILSVEDALNSRTFRRGDASMM